MIPLRKNAWGGVIDCANYPLTRELPNASCSSCSDDKGMHYVCTCNSGYSLVNGQCVEEAKCPDGYSTKYQSLEDCTGSGCYTYSYVTVGDKKCGKCDSTRPPVQRVVSDNNATCVGEWLMCNEEKKCSEWECDPGTTLINGECVGELKTCPDGFSLNYTSVADCGSNPRGWIFQVLGALDGKLCARCMANICTGSYKTEAQCTASAGLRQSCTISGLAHGYAGDDGCYTCNCVDTCPSGYSTAYQSVNDCGKYPSGWDYETSGTLNGLNCGRCTPQTCPYSYKTALDCTNNPPSDHYRCTPSGSVRGYSGDTSCYYCDCDLCPYDCSNCGGPACSDASMYGRCNCSILSLP